MKNLNSSFINMTDVDVWSGKFGSLGDTNRDYDDYVEWFWDTYGEDACDGYKDGFRDAYGYENVDYGLF